MNEGKETLVFIQESRFILLLFTIANAIFIIHSYTEKYHVFFKSTTQYFLTGVCRNTSTKVFALVLFISQYFFL